MRKSGVNLHLTEVGETYDGMHAGTLLSNDAGQTPLATNSIACWQVLIQADPGNIANVLVGTLTEGCYIVLRAGESITIPINNVNKVYVRTVAAGGNQTINWLAMI